MKKFSLALAILMMASTAADAAVLRLSTSNTDPNAGNSLTLNLGASGSMFVWASTAPNQRITGLSTTIVSSNPDVLQGTSHVTENPSNRWFAVGNGVLGDLVSDTNAFVLLSETGINTGDENSFVLHSTIQFAATGIGTTDLSIQRGEFNITDGSTIIADADLTLQGGSVSVVPEPGAFGALGLSLLGLCVRRRRRRV